ncbi:peroxiredoxin [Nonlabens dokdonensis]|uniref:Peroxiredoxin n=2 Tax=Nonlabens dokdonensis TaxID=328515 RepID=A0ABX5PUV3_9FLAO|nr:TlpA disulfide reductase family protein [Nonlabens dokdonensis]AGC78137.1 putative thiol, disulfide interchange protein [Nonlabens dokdonensis DSW-6]PZX37197.1 peroxiredoxin [Nonlabens dokdonensis]
MKYLFIFLSLIAVNQCNEVQKETHFIEGNASGVANGMRVYLNELDENGRTQVIDTSIVMEENFYFDQKEKLAGEEIRFITLDGSEGNFVLLVKNDPLKVELRKDTLIKSTVVGSKANDELKTFKERQSVYVSTSRKYQGERVAALKGGDNAKAAAVVSKWTQAENEFKDYAVKTMTDNNSSIIAPMILGEMLQSKFLDAKASRNYYNAFDEHIKNSIMAQRIDTFLKKAESVAVGAKAPDFEGTSPDGKIIKLSDVLGKVTLIDFWASWCGPCRRENPNVVNAYNKYHSKGFNILSVSLDRPNGEKAWKDAIIKDKMDWNHISRLMYFGPLAKLYNVNAIPATFLLDENGVIIATNLRGQQLHNKLEELLGSS